MVNKEQIKKAYWKGYQDGRINSVKHNLFLLKNQIHHPDKKEDKKFEKIKNKLHKSIEGITKEFRK